MDKNQAKGVSAKRKKPIVIPVEDDPENQWISKADFVKKRTAEKKAKAAGEEARRKVLAEAGLGQKAPEVPKAPSKVDKLRKQLAEAEKRLQGKPDSKSFAKQVKSLSEELEVAESEEI